jgi:hypothetical protein
MIANEQVAADVGTRTLEASRLLNEALLIVHNKCPEAEFLALRFVIGGVLGEMLLSVLNPLYRQHPGLKPEGLEIS